jgi:hypothetical protein
MDPFSTSKLTLLSALMPPKEIVRFSILRIESIISKRIQVGQGRPSPPLFAIILYAMRYAIF